MISVTQNPSPGAEKEYVEDFGPYKLVARAVGGTHCGILWRSEADKPAVKLITLTANSNEEARALVEKNFYQTRIDQASSDGATVLGEQEMVRAWMYIWPHLNANQKKMITAQYHAPLRQMTTLQLAEIAQWDGHSAVNLWYGYIGFMMFGECPRELPTDNRSGKPIFSFSLSTGWKSKLPNGKDIWTWEMRPEVARGLKVAGLVSE